MSSSFENHRLRTCIWIVSLLRREGKMSLKEINEKWLENEELSGGVELERRTFFNYKYAISDMFHINIECEARGGYKYFIATEGGDAITDWLIKSVSASSSIASNADLKDRIVLETVPTGEEYLPQIFEAMRNNRKIAFTYQRFHDLAPQHIKGDPYCVKIFQQRWYVLMKEYRTVLASHEISEEMRIYSFDRMSELQTLDETFKMDKNFNAKEFFRYAWGTRVDGGEPVRLLLKVRAEQCPYFRSLPLHHSQKEIETNDNYSIFEYIAAPTIEMKFQILHYGRLVEVISPEEIRDDIEDELYWAAKQYEKTAEESLREKDLTPAEEVLSAEDIELQKAIETKEQLLEYIDSKLTDEQRKEFCSGSDEIHFGYGLWLRNLIIYPEIINVDALLNPEQDNLGMTYFADFTSERLIDEVKDYLINKYHYLFN